MVGTNNPVSVRQIPEWVRERAMTKGLGPNFHATFMHQEDEWRRYACRVDAGDQGIFDVARILVEVMNEWNEEHPDLKISLLPLAA